MDSIKEFKTPIEGECICEYTISSKTYIFFEHAYIVLIVFGITFGIGIGVIDLIPNSMSWLTKYIYVLSFIAGIYILMKIINDILSEEKNIYFTSKGLTHKISYNLGKYRQFISDEIDFQKMFGVKNGEIIYNNKTYTPSKKYKDNTEELVVFINKMQQEWEEIRLKETRKRIH